MSNSTSAMRRPKVVSSCIYICWAGSALIATSSGSQSNAPLQPPPPPPKSIDRKASPLHSAANIATQQQDEFNQRNHDKRPPPPPQRPSSSDLSSFQQQQNKIASPPPPVQSTASTADATNIMHSQSNPLVRDSSDMRSNAFVQQPQQQPVTRPIPEVPAGPVVFDNTRDKRATEGATATYPPRPVSGADVKSHDGPLGGPPGGIPPRSGVDPLFRQPYNAPPHQPQQPSHDPLQSGLPYATQNRGPLPHRPPGQRQLPPKRQQSPPAWSQLWKRVERGLDGLADLEDVVAERAQQLYSTAKESVSSVYKRPLDEESADSDHDLPSSSSVPSIRIWSKSRSSKPASSPIPQMDMSRFTKTIVTEERGPGVASTAQKEKLPWENVKSSGSVLTNPFVSSMVKESAEAAQPRETSQNGANAFGSGSAKPLADQAGNATNRIIRANGGASTPPFGGPTNGAQNDAQRQSLAPQERPTAPPMRPSPSRNILPTGRGPPQTHRPVQKSFMDDDEEEDRSIVQKMKQALPGIPSFSIFRKNQFDASASATWDAWNAGDSDLSEVSPGFFSRIFSSKGGPRSSSQGPSQVSAKFMSPPLQSFMDRCGDGKTLSLLKPTEKAGSRRIGRTVAALDVVALVFALIGLKQLPKLEQISFPHSLSEAFRNSLPQFAHCFVAGMDTWAPFAFLAAFLTIQTRQLIYKAKLRSLTHILDSGISEEAQYGALFLRLYTSSTYFRDISDKLRMAARSQLTARIDVTRLRALVTILLASMLLMTVPVFTPLVIALFEMLQHIFGLEVLRSWPPKWGALAENIVTSFSAFANKAMVLINEEFAQMSGHPKQAVFGLSIAAALLIVSLMPGTSRRNIVGEPGESDEEEDAQFVKFTEQVSNLGVSSASRLALLSDVGGIDSTLERWRLLIPQGAEIAYTRKSLQSILHILWKGSASAIVLALPLILQHYYSGFSFSSNWSSFPNWGSLVDVSLVLLLTQLLSWKATSSSLLADESRGAVAGFVMSLRNAANERLRRLNAPPVSLQQQVAVSPSAGLEVKDLWTAHTTKRAWAVRGVNLECRSGNVLLILGDDSAGKSRLLTALAEAVSRPPSQAFTTTRVRGSIRVAGIEANTWDHKLLQKRVWSLLHDVRSMSDFAQILSGMSLEEILEPSGGIRYLELSHRPGPNERATMMLALKLAGLYSSLLPKLPSKLSTVVTANEEDIKPSALRPLYSMLSPAEWSKLLLARVFSQAIYENENAASTSDKMENCLVGSLLLLDDATLFLPEVEEARLLRDLRTTGAATILTSNRWALGRLADQIVVMRDGAVLESGTHAELLSRGPQQSLYAAKWHAMTSQ